MSVGRTLLAMCPIIEFLKSPSWGPGNRGHASRWRESSSGGATLRAIIAGSLLLLLTTGANGSAGFTLIQVDGANVGLEPMVAVGPGDVPWTIPSTFDPADPARLYFLSGSTFLQDAARPAVGDIDGAIVYAPDGRLYIAGLWSDAEAVGLASRALPDGAWSTATRLPAQGAGDYDRPWLAATASGAILVVTHEPDRVELWRALNDGAGWTFVSNVFDGQGVSVTAALPSVLPNGTIAVPIKRSTGLNEWEYLLATSGDGGATWSTVRLGDDLTGGPMQGIVQTAADAGGNLYLVWHSGSRVKYAAVTSGGLWRGPFLVDAEPPATGPATTHSPSVVATAEGSVSFSWYSKATGGDWTVLFRSATGAHTASPQWGPEVVVDPHAAAGSDDPLHAFRDLLHVAATSAGKAVVAYSCREAGGGVPSSVCRDDGISHAVVALES